MKSIFLGCIENSKVYRLSNLDSNVIAECREVKFSKNKFLIDFTSDVDEPT